MDLGLDGRVVLITGAGSGIGRHMACAFAAEGARVAVNDIDAAAAAETVRLIEDADGAAGTAHVAAGDVGDLDAVRAIAAAATEALGGIDILVNNAAVLSQHALFLDTDPAANAREIRVILQGAMHCARAVLPGMIDRGYGRIVNIATDAARVGQEREASYAAAKGGVIAFAKSLAREVGRHNITVNVVSPGATNSPMRIDLQAALREKLGEEAWRAREAKVLRMYPLRRIGEMADVTNATLFLASDAARHITGQILSVNGGFAMVG